MNKKGMTLDELREDVVKAQEDFQRLNQQLVQIQGIILYLQDKIKNLEQQGSVK